MSWSHPLVIGLIPVAALAIWWTFRRARAADAPRFTNIRRLWADRRGLAEAPALRARRGRGLLLAAGVAAALLALARPQWGEIAEQSYAQSREVVLALDLSRSMLADDVAPNRLSRAKLLIGSLLDELKGDRVGLIVFAGTAFVQSPLSADYEVLRDFLDELDPSYLPQGGTDYETMLRTAAQAFGQQGGGDRFLVVLSDGEALDENWKSLLPDLREHGIRVIGLGVGTPAGALVPDGAGGLVKDEQGAAVLSRLEPATLQALASETSGTYRDAASWVDIAELVDATVAQGTRGEYVEQRQVRLQDRYQWFLAPALLLLLISYWIEFPLSPLARALPARGRRPHPASAPVIAAALLALAAWQTPRLASAAVSDALPPQSGTASQANPLVATIDALSARPTLSAEDYERLATETITFASQPGGASDSMRSGVIDDALAAVDRGEASDPRAADWPALRSQLEQLKQKPEPPPQEPQAKPQDQQNQHDQQQGDGQQQDDSASESGGAGEQQQNAEQPKDGEQKGQPSSGGAQSAGEQKQPGDQSDSAEQADAQGSAGQGDAAKDEQAASEKPQSAGQQSGDAQHGDEQEKDQAQQAGASGSANADDKEKQQANGGAVERQDDVQPLDAPEAGLAGNEPQEPEKDAEQAAAAAENGPAAQPPPPNSRMVGGGPALPSGEAQGETGALAQAIGTMGQVKDGDAPSVLFDRMNRAEGQPRPRNGGKNW